MPWWGWLVVGAALLASEMFLLDAQFYLVFLGISAALVGLIGWAGIDLPAWAQWLTFGALSLISMVEFRQRVYQRVKGNTGLIEERVVVGDHVVVPRQLAVGETCRIDYRGSSWSARNIGEQPIDAGKEAVIARVDGLTLHVKSA
jgi:membrane protein implicated in regulation of membrane protease activity